MTLHCFHSKLSSLYSVLSTVFFFFFFLHKVPPTSSPISRASQCGPPPRFSGVVSIVTCLALTRGSTSLVPSDVAGNFLGDSPPFSCLVRWSCCRSATSVPNLLPVGQRTGGPERNDRHVVVACHLVHHRLTCSPDQ